MCGCVAERVAAGKGCDVDVVRCVHNGQVWGSVRGRGRAAREVGRLVSFAPGTARSKSRGWAVGELRGWAIVPRGGRGCPIGQRRLSCCLLCVPCLRVHRASEMSAGGRVMSVMRVMCRVCHCGVAVAYVTQSRCLHVASACPRQHFPRRALPVRGVLRGGFGPGRPAVRRLALAGCGVRVRGRTVEHLTEPAGRGGSVGRAGGVPVGTGVRNKASTSLASTCCGCSYHVGPAWYSHSRVECIYVRSLADMGRRAVSVRDAGRAAQTRYESAPLRSVRKPHTAAIKRSGSRQGHLHL
jgi:hypothetical protein